MAGVTIWTDEKKEMLLQMMNLNPNQYDVARVLGIHVNTLHKFVKYEYGVNWEKFKEDHMQGVKLSLVNRALKEALSGNNTMLIFALKNICHWTDKHQISGDARAPIVLKYKLDDL